MNYVHVNCVGFGSIVINYDLNCIEAAKPTISSPDGFVHRVHVGFDSKTGEFTVSVHFTDIHIMLKAAMLFKMRLECLRRIKCFHIF